MSFQSPSTHPAVELLPSFTPDSFTEYRAAVAEREKMRTSVVRTLQEQYGDDLSVLRAKLAEAGDPELVRQLDGLMMPGGSISAEKNKWLQENPIEASAINEAEQAYKSEWAEIFETVKGWGARAREMIEAIVSGAVDVLKTVRHAPLLIVLALIVLGGGLYGGLELLQLAEWGGFDVIRDQLTAILGENFIDWDGFQSILPEVSETFEGLGHGEIGSGNHLGKPIG